MPLNIIEASKIINEKYKDYLKTIFKIKDPEYNKKFLDKLNAIDSFSKGPFLDVVDSFSKGLSVKELIDENVLSSDFKYIDPLYNRTLYKHQELALRKISSGKNVVVSTGTGSGKTECFLMPIINDLMKERENNNGKLKPGVRAIIIYPMNALANDQIDRLRKYLKHYSYITFGCYTGQTAEQKKTALNNFKQLNITEECPDPVPLPNEVLSREEMKENPPHILITNYAMLEYLMLRPQDNVFFNGDYANKWKYIVLDEAHTYVGSTGIEVSMLLRRVFAQLDIKKLQYILTSATLGSDDSQNKNVIKFAKNLCNVKFYEEDIIRALRVDLNNEKSDNLVDFTFDFYNKISKAIADGLDEDAIKNEYLNVNNNLTLSENLYFLLLGDSLYWKIKDMLFVPKSVVELCEQLNCSTEDLSNFVIVASLASKNGSKLFDARYHFFIRATDGVYITLGKEKEVYLERHKEVTLGGRDYKVFETVACTQCNSLYLVGQIENDFFVQKSINSAENVDEAFYIGNTINDTDDDCLLEDEDLKTDIFELCPYCGYIRKANQKNQDCCDHGDSDYVKLVRVKTSDTTKRVTKCISCEGTNNLGILRGFFTGQEASTSVLGTALYEVLPDYDIKKVISKNQSDDIFGLDFELEPEEIKIPKYKQFIAFSDNRQAAAYFATYFGMSYEHLLYSSIVLSEIKKLPPEGRSVGNFCNHISHIFKENNIYPNFDTSPDFIAEAQKAVIKELVECKRKNTLISMGLMDFDIDGSYKDVPSLKLSSDELKTILKVFISQMFNDFAVSSYSLSDKDISFYAPNGVQNYYEKQSNNPKKNVKSFLPKVSGRLNKRLDYIKRVLTNKGLTLTDDLYSNILSKLWDVLTLGKESSILKVGPGKKDQMHVNLDKIKIIHNQKHWYKCSKCGKITSLNIDNICPTYRCTGKLSLINVHVEFKDNHYYKTYNNLSLQPLRVVEHTAQLNRTESYDYQKKFTEKKINVLSCSTTFEMGVDVGSLETVFMRNMPPAPANYAQRAGRAGRSTSSAAFALTFCNKSNHDLNFFNDPVSMIKGVISPPQFKIENKKICIRHIYSAAFAFFWRKYPEYFKTIEFFFEEKEGVLGIDVFRNYLNTKPENLKRFLLKFVPDELIDYFEIDTFGWVSWMFEVSKQGIPNLLHVFKVYDAEIEILLEEKNRLNSLDLPTGQIVYRLKHYREEPIISFLSKNNILPKYGFPVDTVNLETNAEFNLELSRDLSMAIAEYAPECEIVANGRLLTSRYIKTVPGRGWKLYDYVSCDSCQTLNMCVHTDTSKATLNECSRCHSKFNQNQVKTFLIPDFGFIAENKDKKPSMIKPEKTYRTEVAFVGNRDIKDVIEKNGYEVGNYRLQVDTMENGRLAVLNRSEFYVCNKCGFALNKDKLKKFTNLYYLVHKNSQGYECKNDKLETFSLGYRFETDVIRIKFENLIGLYEAHSILQALIISSNRVLNIDSKEISGCLEVSTYKGKRTYSFILYDTTPGGAGHVKRLNNIETLKLLFKGAYKIVSECSCGGNSANTSCYECLRTYQNQKIHDWLSRKFVIEFFDEMDIKKI